VIGGSNNVVTNYSQQASILGGNSNFISSSLSATILGGQGNRLNSSTYSTILGGRNSLAYSAPQSTMIAGQNHFMSSSTNAAILGGIGHNVTLSTGSIIMGGGNTATYQGGIITSSRDSVILGLPSWVDDTHRRIQNSPYSTMIGTGGYINEKMDVGGNHLKGGINNSILGSDNSFITGGEYNVITGSDHCHIIGAGTGVNTISGLTGTTIIGTGITATTSNTVYVNNFNIYETPTVSTATDNVLVRNANGNIETVDLTPDSYAFQTLTYALTTSWDMDVSINAIVTLTGDTTLDITNVNSGQVGLIKIIQDVTGTRLLTLPANSIVINGGAGAITLSTDPNAIDVLSFIYDGTDFMWTYGPNYN